MSTTKRVSVLDLATGDGPSDYEDLVNRSDIRVTSEQTFPTAIGGVLRVVEYRERDPGTPTRPVYAMPVC